MKAISCFSLMLLVLLPVLAVAQDTPSDSVHVVVNGTVYPAYEGVFGVQFEEDRSVGPLPIVAAEPEEACEPLTNAEEVFGNIVLIRRGTCPFTAKVEAAADAGAAGVVVYNVADISPDGLVIMTGDCAPDVCSTRAVFVSEESGLAIATKIKFGTDAVLNPVRVTPPVKDIVATATSPLTVSPGGSVSFDVAVTNNTNEAASGELVFTTERDGAVVVAGRLRYGTVQAGATATLRLTQNVPSNAEPGRYIYLLNISEIPPGDIDDAEAFAVLVAGATASEGTPAPAASAVSAYPNPFASRTEIGFALERASQVSLVVYDVRGREVATLAEGAMPAGAHRVMFDGSGLPSGVYVYRLVAGGHVETGRITLVR